MKAHCCFHFRKALCEVAIYSGRGPYSEWESGPGNWNYPMGNLVCWRCEREAWGAVMLMGRPAEKWLVKNQDQMKLELAGS